MTQLMETAAEAEATLSSAAAKVSVVVPTFNERGNVRALVEKLEECLQGETWEVIFVDDDSPDGTSELVREIARVDRRVRGIQRLDRRGLSNACIEGILSSSAPLIVVIDGDLQHDERIIPEMLSDLRSGDFDLVVGSRYIDGGGIRSWSGERILMSRIATVLSRVVVHSNLADPLSGFFAIRREAFENSVRRLSGQGFKLLLDIMAASPHLRVKERPYQFGPRRFGQSKLDSMVLWEFAMLLGGQITGRRLPARFVLFACIGALGVFVHLAALRAGLYFDLSFRAAQLGATYFAMTSNFWLNNIFTFRDMRLRGWGFVKGLASFYLICSVGAAANVGVAQLIYGDRYSWWAAGLAGAALSAVWNYVASAIFTWGKPRHV